jgi:hypothetical protein
MGAAREAPNSSETKFARDRGVPSLAGSGIAIDQTEVGNCYGCDGGTDNFRASFRVTRERGKILSSKFAEKVVVTVHPSSLLRQPDEASREREYNRFVADLHVALQAATEK